MTERDRSRRAELLVSDLLNDRLDHIDQRLSLREAVVDGITRKMDSVTDRLRQQFDQLCSPNSSRIPDAYLADEEAVEEELQGVAAGIRTALALGGVIGDPVMLERSLTKGLQSTGIWSLRTEASRVPRPNTRASVLEWSLIPIPQGKDEETEWPPRDAAALADIRQLVGEKAKPVRVVEEPYKDWVQIGLFELQRTLASKHPPTRGKQLLVASGLEIGSAPSMSMPLSSCPPDLWTHSYTQLDHRLDRFRAQNILRSSTGPLVALVEHEGRLVGHRRGPGLHPVTLSPRVEVVAALGLQPESPAIRHVLHDDKGPAMVCRLWHGFLIHDGTYNDLVPAVHGCDLILRDDLFESLVEITGRDRLTYGIATTYSREDDDM